MSINTAEHAQNISPFPLARGLTDSSTGMKTHHFS